MVARRQWALRLQASCCLSGIVRRMPHICSFALTQTGLGMKQTGEDAGPKVRLKASIIKRPKTRREATSKLQKLMNCLHKLEEVRRVARALDDILLLWGLEFANKQILDAIRSIPDSAAFDWPGEAVQDAALLSKKAS